MALRNISNYARQFSTGLNAGLPINRVLYTLSRTAPTRQLRAASNDANRSIESGATLVQAFEKHRGIFPEFFRNMIRVGETTGRLEQVAASLADYYEQRYAIAREARHQLYPILAYAALLMSACLFITWITRGPAALKSYTDVLAWIVLAAMVVWAAYYFSRGFRDAVGSALFHIPFVQRLVTKFSLSKFCQGMQLASEAGLDINAAIRLSAEGSGNPAFRRRVLRACEYIEQGSLISEALDRTGVFPFESVQMFIVGEETGKLHESMAHIAKLAREEALGTLRLTLIFGIRALYLLVLIYMAFTIVGFYLKIYGGILRQF